MYNPEKYSDLIQDYLKGLTSAEQNNFVTNELKSNPDFKTLFEEEQLIFETIVFSELYELENTIKSFTPKPKTKNYWMAIGGIIVLSLVSLYYISKDNTLNTEPINQVEKTITKPTNKSEKLIPYEKNTESPKHNNKISVTDNIQSKTDIIDSSVIQLKDTTLSTAITPVDTVKMSLTNIEDIKPIDSLPIVDVIISKCASTDITFKSNIIPTCENDATGSISIYNINGGKEEYIVTINNDVETENLKEGKYEVVITDEAGCKSTPETLNVSSRKCFETQDFVFSTNQNNYFTTPVTGKLLVMDIYGQIIYTQYLEEGEKWYLKTNNGDYLSMGDYNYLIENETKNYTGVITVLE